MRYLVTVFCMSALLVSGAFGQSDPENDWRKVCSLPRCLGGAGLEHGDLDAEHAPGVALGHRRLSIIDRAAGRKRGKHMDRAFGILRETRRRGCRAQEQDKERRRMRLASSLQRSRSRFCRRV